MTYDELIEHFGSQTAVARALELEQPSVWAWRDATIPFERQCQIQLVTGGLLQARREDDGRPRKKRVA